MGSDGRLGRPTAADAAAGVGPSSAPADPPVAGLGGGAGDPAEVRAWARTVARDHLDVEPLDLAVRVGTMVVSAMGGRPESVDLIGPPRSNRSPTGAGAPIELEPPGGWADPWLPGLVHEQAVSATERTGRGAWYTPASVVRGLVALAIPDGGHGPARIIDPTCGGGAFLLAGLDRLVELGVDPTLALGRVVGMDIDADAVAVSRLAVVLWAEAHGAAGALDRARLGRIVTVGDALVDGPPSQPEPQVVIGNPPFASPLRAGAVPASAQTFREERRDVLGPYSDLAVHHLLRAVETSAPGSTIALVLPQSVLAGRDTEALRAHLADRAPLHGLWAAREPLFDAGTRVCAVVLRPGVAAPSQVPLSAGPAVEPCRSSPAVTWSGLAARALGAPDLPAGVRHASSGRLGEIVSATAGFRDEYYGLVEACREWEGADGDEPNRLMTVGAVEPLASLWGASPIRLGGARWQRPHIEVDALPDKVARWWERQARPKVVVATQSKLLEPLIDPDGRIVPATPLIAVHADPDDLTRIAAVLLAPPVVAWAWERWFGTALTVDGLKLAARQVAELPLPADRDAWSAAAAVIDDAMGSDRRPGSADARIGMGWRTACEVAAIMNRAYGADDAVLDWWSARSGGRGDRG